MVNQATFDDARERFHLRLPRGMAAQTRKLSGRDARMPRFFPGEPGLRKAAGFAVAL